MKVLFSLIFITKQNEVCIKTEETKFSGKFPNKDSLEWKDHTSAAIQTGSHLTA